MIREAHIEIFRDRTGKYRWHCVSINGKIVSASDFGYASKRSAKRSIDITQSARRA